MRFYALTVVVERLPQFLSQTLRSQTYSRVRQLNKAAPKSAKAMPGSGYESKSEPEDIAMATAALLAVALSSWALPTMHAADIRDVIEQLWKASTHPCWPGRETVVD